MTERYVAFDLETAKVLPAYESPKHHRPLGIACAAAALSDDAKPVVWHGVSPDGSPAPQMSTEEVSHVVDSLTQWVSEGYHLVTLNGQGFDLDILAEESGRHEDCARLALDHIDMMFQAVCVLGHAISLGKAAEGMWLPGKSSGVQGADAPKYWAEGRHRLVLEYVAQDAKLTLQVALAALDHGSLYWIARSGKRRSMPLHSGWLCVQECRGLPLPDTRWMDDPPSRDQYTEWLRF